MSQNKSEDKFAWVFVVIFLLAGIGFVNEYIWPTVKSFGISIFADSTSKNVCSRHPQVLNAKTDFASKKAYKACLRRLN